MTKYIGNEQFLDEIQNTDIIEVFLEDGLLEDEVVLNIQSGLMINVRASVYPDDAKSHHQQFIEYVESFNIDDELFDLLAEDWFVDAYSIKEGIKDLEKLSENLKKFQTSLCTGNDTDKKITEL